MCQMKAIFQEKNFYSHLLKIDKLISQNIDFAFNRISDGELFMLQGKEIKLSSEGAVINNQIVNRQRFNKWDEKSFNAMEDTYIVNGLRKALTHSSQNYIIGLPCPCCADIHAVEECRLQANEAATTWANLFVNANYNHFINTTLNLILERPVMAAVNHRCDTTLFKACPLFKWFKIPDGVIQKAPLVCEKFLDACSVLPDHTIVLVSASAAAKIMIQAGNQYFSKLTFIDIGTTLNPLLRLGLGRDYLNNYWKPKSSTHYGNQKCVW